MVGRAILSRAEPGFTMPAFERLAPAPPPELVSAHIEAHSGPGDIVADLHGRGGWVARAAIDRQRRALTMESNPLTRLLAEVVLRPPDLRHLDAAFSALASSPRGDSSLKLAIGAMFATRCATCGRSLIADEVQWAIGGEGGPGPAGPRPIRKVYRCSICRDQQGGLEQRQAALDEDDLARAHAEVGGAVVRRALRERFPVPEGGADLVTGILDLHTDRQLVGLAAILERVESELRAAPVESSLRLAFLHAVLPASRLGGVHGRLPQLRLGGGTVRTPIPDPFRERNPWTALEDGYRQVRAFVQRLEGGALGPLEARMATDLRALAEGVGTAVIRVLTPSALEALSAEGRTPEDEPSWWSGGAEDGAPAAARVDRPRGRIRLLLGYPPLRFSQERLGAAYHGTAWALGRDAAALLPVEALLGPSVRAPWSWQATALRRSLAAAAPVMARDGRAVIILESGGAEALVAAVLGGVGAGYRVVEARLAEAEEDGGGVVELIPPNGILPPPARTRAGRPLEPVAGGRGDPAVVPGPGVFSAPEKPEARPFSHADASRSITELAVEILRQRGEPARYERLLGELLVGLDRAGHLRRLMALADVGGAIETSLDGGPAAATPPGPEAPPPAPAPGGDPLPPGPPRTTTALATGSGAVAPVMDPVERVLALVRDELARPTQRRLEELEPGRWWLADREDREAAEVPLADRVEWAAYSLLSTAGPLPERAFFERVAALFTGHDQPDEALVRACLASYRSPASTAERLVTGEDVRRRTAEHTELLAHLANGGHAIGMSVALGRREQGRRIGDGILADFLDDREREPWLPIAGRVPEDDLDAIDCIWYQRGRSAVIFEVEWTAMLGDVLLRRHARIPHDERLVRVLAIAPERAELVRYKLETSPLLRAAIAKDNWHLILWPCLRAWLDREPPSLDAIEPFLGLDPAIERQGEQLGLFDGEARSSAD